MKLNQGLPIFGAMLLLTGCNPTVSVQTPEKPITVNLNVNVQHQVEVKVADDVNTLFKDNPDLF